MVLKNCILVNTIISINNFRIHDSRAIITDESLIDDTRIILMRAIIRKVVCNPKTCAKCARLVKQEYYQQYRHSHIYNVCLVMNDLVDCCPGSYMIQGF